LNVPRKIALDSEGNLLFAESSGYRIRKVSIASGTISTLAGSGQRGFFGDGALATTARMEFPYGVALDAAGDLYIADTFNDRIRRVSSKTSIIDTIVGIGQTTPLGDQGPATAAPLNNPQGIAIDLDGNLLIADSRHNKIRKVDAVTGTITTVAGTGQKGGAGDNGAATSALFTVPVGIALDSAGNLFIVDSLTHRIRKVTATTGIITTVAGGIFGYGGDDGPASQAQFRSPEGVALDPEGNIFVADTLNHRIRRIDAKSQVITTVVGTGSTGFNGDNIPASSAQIGGPGGVAVDPSGNLLIADTGNHRIRKVWKDTQLITTVAGSRLSGDPGDNGPATAARLSSPRRVLVTADGTLFIADTFGNRVRRVDATTGIITTIAGKGQAGFAGDAGLSVEALLLQPSALALGMDGTLYIADTANSRIRAIRGPVR
jgi:sugar lactone lactonase YvrE